MNKDAKIHEITKRFLWNLVHQQEKVHGSLTSLVNTIFTEYDDVGKLIILTKIKDKLNKGLK